MESLPKGNTASQSHGGYLQLIMGPMFSGKTSKILSVYRQLLLCGVKTLVVNYAEDKRYSDSQLSTHDKTMIPCIFINKLSELNEQYSDKLRQSDAVLINEGQFFPDICEWTEEMVDKEQKKIYICGLDGDFRRKKFGSWLDLIPLADDVVKLKSICPLCKNGTAGLFSYRVNKEVTQQISIGSDSYLPLCRGCYLSQNT